MKKLFALFLAALLVLSFAACTGDTDDPTDASADASADVSADASADVSGEDTQTDTLKVGFDAEFPPFGFINADGDYDGFDLAMAKEVCDRLGWTFVAQPIDWGAKDAELNSGNIDCIWNGFTINGREDDYTWTAPYYDNSIVMVVKADSGIASLADLAGKNVAVQLASSAETTLNKEETAALKATFGDLIAIADYNSAFMELNQGTVDAIAVDLGVAKFNIANNDGEYVILDETVSTEQYGIGFKLGNTALAAQVWEQVEAIAADGTMAEIAAEYVDSGLVMDALVLLSE